MMKSNKIIGILLGGALALALTACVKEPTKQQYSFNATMEQLQNADSYGSKVQLVNEEWTYWEPYDSINLVSNASVRSGVNCQLFTGWLVNGGGGDYSDYNGVFITTLTETDEGASKWFVGIHPARYNKHKITYNTGSTNHGFAAEVYLDPVQHYRHDSSYARQVLPMIAVYDGPAWDAANPNPYRLDFHSLAGLVRLQLVNGTGTATNISKIELTSIDFDAAPSLYQGTSKLPLSGLFPVKNLYNFNAHLNPAGSDLGYTLTLSTDETAATGSLAFAANEIKSFYVVLPAFHGMDSTTAYRLQMTVTTTGGDVFKAKFNANTRRNGITYLRAINITAFDGSNGSGNQVLVGNGTATRPFKIYSLADLKYLRNCYNVDTAVGTLRTINGQPITKDTYIRIMRSDIILSTDDGWDEGIKDFRGHLTYYTNAHVVTHGITNRTPYPLFQKITSQGYVNDLNIICDRSINISAPGISETHYSPLCQTNEGQITDCRIISPSGLSNENRLFTGKPSGESCFSGICVTNDGVITNCACAVLRSVTMYPSNFAGICQRNNGTVSACVASSPLSVIGAANAGGICYYNNSLVKDCYCDFHYTTSDGTGETNWGGIVYENLEGTSRIIRNCYVSANAIIRSYRNVGGIVCNNAGLVDYCHAESASLLGAEVGGIASTLSGGELRNCYINSSSMVIYLYNKPAASHSAGGLVAVMSGGAIKNSFAHINHIDIAAADATGKIGTVVGVMSGSSTIDNCYGLSTSSSSPTFYGDKGSCALTHCHLVGAEQAGVEGITTVNHTTLEALLSSLNSNKPANGLSWTRGLAENESSDTALPTLVPPASTKHRRTR